MRTASHTVSRRRRAAAFFALGLMLVASSAAALTTEWKRHEPVSVRVVVPYERLPIQGEVTFGLEARLAPEWHIYWKNPGDAGLPPNVEVSGPRITGSEILFPAPHRYELPGDLVAFGYADEVVYPLLVEMRSDAADTVAERGATTAVELSVDYLVCAEECIPFSDEFELELPIGETAVPVTAEMQRLARWRDEVPRPVDELSEVRASTGLSGTDPPRLVLRIDGVTGTERSDLFLEAVDGVELGTPVRSRREARRDDGDPIGFEVPIRATTAAGLPETLELAWTVTEVVVADDAAVTAVSGTSRLTAASTATSLEPAGRTDPATPWYHDPLVLVALSFVALAVVAVLWHAARRLAGDHRGTLLRGASFFPLALLVWVSYRLAPTLPSHDLAFVQLGWLAFLLLTGLFRRDASSVARLTVLSIAVAVVCSTLWIAWF